MNYNNLYQILKIDKNASQEQIIKVSQELVKKDSPDKVGIASLVLSDPQKRKEYDRIGWKEEWRKDWEKERSFRHSIFEAIQNYKHNYGNTYALKPDGFRVYVWDTHHLDPNLWTPSNSWVDKIWDIRGSDWKQELENFKNKMLAALDEAWEKEKKTPLLGDCWEGVESGNCAKCGKTARLRRKGEHSDGKEYCSQECYRENWEARYKVPKYEYAPENLPFSSIKPAEKDNGYCVYCQKKNGPETWNWDNTKSGKYEKYCSNACREKASANYCDNCQKQIEKYREGHAEVSRVIFTIDSNGKKGTFCSEDCQKKWQQKPGNKLGITKLTKLGEFLAKKKDHSSETVEVNRLTGKTTTVKNNPLQELLNWMKKEGITNISLNSQGNLVVEYGNLKQTVADNNLTTEQKEIKEFFQQLKEQGGQTYFSQKELEAAVATEGTNSNKVDKNNWLVPATIIGLGAIIIVLIGVIIYKNKKKNY